MTGDAARRDGAEAQRLAAMLDGYRATCLVTTAVKLGLVERLKERAVNHAELARELGVHLPSLQRLLRALTALGLLETRADTVSLSSMGRLLIAGASPLYDLAVLTGEQYLPAWTALEHSVTTAEPAFDRVFGMNAWQHRAEHAEVGVCFDRRMGRDPARTVRAIEGAHDFSTTRSIVDVGGGHGGVVAALLARFSRLQGVLFDRAQVLAGAEQRLKSAGVLERCQVVAGSFFDGVPSGGDVYLLQHVLHDWDDERCVTILKNCRGAMHAQSTLLVVESVMPLEAPFDPGIVLRDIHMLAVLGGRERTLDEFRRLLSDAGFAFAGCSGLRVGANVIAATPSPVSA